MLRVTLTFVPYGLEDLTRPIGELTIANDGTGTLEMGNYYIHLVAEAVACEARVEDYPRSHGAWRLVLEALQVLLAQQRERGHGASREQ